LDNSNIPKKLEEATTIFGILLISILEVLAIFFKLSTIIPNKDDFLVIAASFILMQTISTGET